MTQNSIPAGHLLGDRPSSLKVKIWGVLVNSNKKGQTYTVRWLVAGQRFRETFEAETAAEVRRGQLINARSKGEAFDIEHGVPVSELARLLAEKAEAAEEAPELTWYEHCVDYVDRRWKWLSANSRRSVADTLATVMPALLPEAPGRPPQRPLRLALYQWAFDLNRRERETLPADVERILAWIADHSPPATAMAASSTVLTALEAIGSTQDGRRAAANTVARKRAVLSSVLEFGVGEFLEGNPLPAAAKKKWNQPKMATIDEVDPRVVVNPTQAAALIEAMRTLMKAGPMLMAFYACLYYAGLRPSEAVRLRRDNLDIPTSGSGTLLLEKSGATAGRTWTDSGKRRDDRGLKWRSEKEVRPVPCSPMLTELLQEHLHTFGTTPDGRLFRGVYGGELSESVYERLLKRAREQVFTPAEVASPLARRPYDLRHACLSTWLSAGIDPPQVAKWAGNSVRVLLATYAKCLAGQEASARQRAEQAQYPTTG